MSENASNSARPMPRAHRDGRGFTLLEVLVALTVVIALASVVMPMLSDDSRLRAMAAASILSSDIELAQVMTIAHPQSPVVVRFDAAQSRYWLARSTTPNTPIARADTGEPYLVTLGEGRARGASGVTFTLEDLPTGTLTFASHGGLTDFTLSPRIKLARSTRGIQLAITPNTGSIVETEFTPESKGETDSK